MSTRYQQTPGPLSQQRYMSSPEFAELHGINGVASFSAGGNSASRGQDVIWFGSFRVCLWPKAD